MAPSLRLCDIHDDVGNSSCCYANRYWENVSSAQALVGLSRERVDTCGDFTEGEEGKVGVFGWVAEECEFVSSRQ